MTSNAAMATVDWCPQFSGRRATAAPQSAHQSARARSELRNARPRPPARPYSQLGCPFPTAPGQDVCSFLPLPLLLAYPSGPHTFFPGHHHQLALPRSPRGGSRPTPTSAPARLLRRRQALPPAGAPLSHIRDLAHPPPHCRRPALRAPWGKLAGAAGGRLRGYPSIVRGPGRWAYASRPPVASPGPAARHCRGGSSGPFKAQKPEQVVRPAGVRAMLWLHDRGPGVLEQAA